MIIRHCAACGSARLELKVPRRDDRERPVCADCGHVHYIGPALAAGVILHRDEELCFVRRSHDPGRGLWSFPGGFVDLEEEPESAAVREALEETGYEAEIDGLLGAWRSTGPGGKQVVILVYTGRARGKSNTDSWEVDEVRWFKRDELPWNELAFESTRHALRTFLDRA